MGKKFVSVEDIHMEDLSAFAEITLEKVIETYDDDYLTYSGEPNIIAPLVEVMSSLGAVCTIDNDRRKMGFKLPLPI